MSVRVKPKPTPDLLLLGATVALLGLGIEMVYSASFVLAGTSFLTKQVMMAVIGLAVMAVLTTAGYHWLERYSALIMGIALVLLVVVLIPGVSGDRYGAHRWVGIGGLPEVQPSEITKLAMIIYMSAWLGRKREQIKEFWRGFLPFALILGGVTVAIMIEPDMGTAFVIATTATCIFFVAGANLLHFVALGAAGVVGFAYLMVAASYRVDRLTAFLDPWQDARGAGWHTIQTLIALGSGGVTGLGLGASRQKFFYVPNAHTDAIFAIIGEELGLLGAAGVILLFAVIAWRGFTIALGAPDRFGRLLATGVTCVIVIQALTNVAVVTNTVPYTGITLPLISYGGSSLVVTLAGVGLLLAVSRYVGVTLPAVSQARETPRRHLLSDLFDRKPARPRPMASSASLRRPRERRKGGFQT
ncbi:MAG TPA: putative lipid II flippase FtsW [Chloroflexota bacterium]